MNTLKLDSNVIYQLLSNPYHQVNTEINGDKATLQIAIPDYNKNLLAFYGDQILPDFATAQQRAGIDFNTKHFGLIIRFEQAAVIQMHDQQLQLLGDSKELIRLFEAVIIRNVQVDEASRDIGHRNRFPHLNFHRDRNSSQPTPYSLYTRDPQDSEQQKPRISSTLFASNIIGYLQCTRERNFEHIKHKGTQSHYNIFHHEQMADVLNNVVLEHRWDEPIRVGEISMLDNRTTLHASYLRQPNQHGYRIGVRYLC